jgi:hypothetical protein
VVAEAFSVTVTGQLQQDCRHSSVSMSISKVAFPVSLPTMGVGALRARTVGIGTVASASEKMK